VSTGYLYSIAEGFRGLRRAKFSTFVAISTIFLSLLLIGVFIIFLLNARRIIVQIQSRMELEVYIDNSYTEDQINELREIILNIPGIDSVRYVSKAEALEIINNQLDQDVLEILEENPLPSSFQIKLKPDFGAAKNAEIISDKLLKLEGVDEVFYRKDLLQLFQKYIRMFFIVIFGAGILLAFGSIFLVSNTIKLIIFSRSNIIEIMKLVGATRIFVRRPFVIEGVIQGIIGGALAAAFFYFLFRIIKLEIPGFIFIDPKNYLILFLLGLLFGIVGSIFALRKFLKF
jgi:cell division transport system permease protein